MGPGTLLAKIDIKSAYCTIRVPPVNRHLLGMSWKSAMPTQLRPLASDQPPPQHTHTAIAADTLEWILQQYGFHTCGISKMIYHRGATLSEHALMI